MRLRYSTARWPARGLIVGLLAALVASLSLWVVAGPAQAVPSLYQCLDEDGKIPSLNENYLVTAILTKTDFGGRDCPAKSKDSYDNDQVRFITQPSEVEVCTTLTFEATKKLAPPPGWKFSRDYYSILCEPSHALVGPLNAAILVCDTACPPTQYPNISFVGSAASWGLSQHLNVGEYKWGLAVQSAGVIYGSNLFSGNEPVTAPIDPQQGCVTSLGGREVRITSWNRHQQNYPVCLTYMSKEQINFYLKDYPIPLDIHKGEDAKLLLWDTGTNAPIALSPKPDTCPLPPEPCTPRYEQKVPLRGVHAGLYSTTSNGRGVPSAYIVRVHDGQQSIETFSGTVNMGPDGDEVYLVLYGTGIRLRTHGIPVNVYLGGIYDGRHYGTSYPARVVQASYAGPAPGLDKAGTDQINVKLPRDIASTADPNRGNVVYVRINVNDVGQAPAWGQWSNVLGFTVAS
jgi:hypothetical protein